MDIFNRKWIESQGFKFEEREKKCTVFKKEIRGFNCFIYLPNYFPDKKSEYFDCWWKNTAIKITNIEQFENFFDYTPFNGLNLPRNGIKDLKKTPIGYYDKLGKKYYSFNAELLIINYHNISIESKKEILIFEIDEIYFYWQDIKENGEWVEITKFEDIGYIQKPINEDEILKIKLIKFEYYKEFPFKNVFIGLFNNQKIYNDNFYSYTINNKQKKGQIIYRQDLAQFQITDQNTNQKYAIQAVQFI